MGIGWIEIGIGVVGALGGLAALILLYVRERRAQRRFRILAEIATVSDAGGSLERTLGAICDTLVPEMADFCMIDVFADGEVRRAAVDVAPGPHPGMKEWLLRRKPSIPDRMVAGNGSRSLEPQFYERISDADLQQLAHDEEELEFMRKLGIRSAVTVALNARGRVIGALTIAVAWSGRRYGPDDAHFAWILSGRVALALDNCGLFADLERAERTRAEIGETLQRGLLPPPLPHIPGWSIAAMYQPAGAENEVGGDFYDAFRVPGGWMLAIGDVTGRGAAAASITAVARYTLRTAVALTADPLLALATLNRALLGRTDPALCSLVALALAEDSEQPLRMAVAGHPPPLLVDGEAVVEVAGAGPVLGAFPDAQWEVEQRAIEPGQQLVIVTDGITEALGPEGRFGEERLHDELRGTGEPALAMRRLETTLNAFTGGRHEDDVAILALARGSGETAVAGSLGSPEVALGAQDLAGLDV